MRTGAERKGVTTRTACASGKRTNSGRRGICAKAPARRRGGLVISAQMLLLFIPKR